MTFVVCVNAVLKAFTRPVRRSTQRSTGQSQRAHLVVVVVDWSRGVGDVTIGQLASVIFAGACCALIRCRYFPVAFVVVDGEEAEVGVAAGVIVCCRDGQVTIVIVCLGWPGWGGAVAVGYGRTLLWMGRGLFEAGNGEAWLWMLKD